MVTEIGKRAARILLQIGAIRVHAEPVKLKNGWLSPVYVNVRKLISHRSAREVVVDMVVPALVEQGGFIWGNERGEDSRRIDVIAGGETAGIPFAAWIADRMGLPMIYVRKTAKPHGLADVVEGDLTPGNRVLLVEDLITDGGSKIDFVRHIRAAGGICDNTFAIFNNGVAAKTLERNLEYAKVNLHTMVGWPDVLAVLDESSMSESDKTVIRSYLAAPATWGRIDLGERS